MSLHSIKCYETVTDIFRNTQLFIIVDTDFIYTILQSFNFGLKCTKVKCMKLNNLREETELNFI
jgi:hypothetical protein